MNKINKYYKALIFFSIVLLLFLFIKAKSFRKNKYEFDAFQVSITDTEPNLEHKGFGEIKSIIQHGDTWAMAIHYPIWGHTAIDRSLETKIQNYIYNFKNLIKDVTLDDNTYKGELNIDYDVYSPGGDIVSIKFIITENLPYYAHPNIEVLTTTYDLGSGLELDLKDIMRGKFLEEISYIALESFSDQDQYMEYLDTPNFQQGLAPLADNYSSFTLSKDYISFIFQKYQIVPGFMGIPEISIPYDLLYDFIRPEFINKNSKETFYHVDSDNRVNEDLSDIEVIPNRKIDPNLPMVALTFDDGPYDRATIPILDVLKEHNSVATFFVLGNRVTKHREIVQRIIMEGNEIGNHSFNHKQLTTIPSKEIKDQIVRTQNAVIEVAGIEPKIMRPTYGSYDNKLREQVNMPMILWSIDTEDWKNKNAQKIKEHVLENVRDGDIVLMHDMYISTAEAVEELVPELINMGFQLVTVSELYEVRGEALEVGNIYSRTK